MTQSIQNGITTLENLFAVNTFRIPQYQRAYSWEKDPHLEAFLEDLRQQVSTHQKAPSLEDLPQPASTHQVTPKKQYFLGTFLLHEQDIGNGRNVVNIVDGQQRMTTSVVFIATGLALLGRSEMVFTTENPAVLKRNFVFDVDTKLQKFHTILEDEPFFRSKILGISDTGADLDSPSSHRLNAAADFFSKHVKPEEWEPLIQALKSSKVMVYVVNSAEDATQIFELQNDRGKSLTSLEALKSFLMHCVYLHSPKSADDCLAALQTQFSKIFRLAETLAQWKRTPDEDQLLSNHCTAFLKWTDKEYNNPKSLVKSMIKTMSGDKVIPWIEEFVNSLLTSFSSIKEIFDRRDQHQEFAELLVLGRMGSYWPLILKTWRSDQSSDKKSFRLMCRLLEVFTFRGYAIAGLRADTSVSNFNITARDFSGNFVELFKQLAEMSNWHDLETRFQTGLDNRYFYQNEGSDALYLLWRYENFLRQQTGNNQPLLSWRDVIEPRSNSAKFSVEHVAARENPISDTVVEWNDGEPKSFHEVALDRLGNLVIDSISSNASKGKKGFSDKIQSLSVRSIYLSQGELIKFLPDPKVLIWDVEAIRSRHQHLIAYALKIWNPQTWYSVVESIS